MKFLFDPTAVTAVLSQLPQLRSLLGEPWHEGQASYAFSTARTSSRQIYRVLGNLHYAHLGELLEALEFCLARGFSQPTILRTRARKPFAESLAELQAARHLLAREFEVRGQDLTKDQAPVPDLIVAGHGLEVAVEVYCPRQWEALGELDEFAAVLKNLDVAYDYDYEVRVGQLERFDEQGLIQLHPGILAARLKPEVRRHLLNDLLEELAVTLVDAPPSVRVERRREDLNLGVSIALTSIERSRGRLPSRTGGLSGPSITGYDPVGMFDRLVDKRVRAKAARGQAVGHARLSLLLVDLSCSELTSELGDAYYREEFEEKLWARLGQGLEGYDMIAFCEPRGWRHDLRLHFIVREEHLVEEVPALLFGHSDREPCESARRSGSAA
jgi:hypothetical protein